MFRRTGSRYLAALAFAVVFASGATVHAGMIPVNVSVQPDGDKFRWTYGVVVTTDVNVSLQMQVAAKHTAGEPIAQAVTEVATAWLQSEHLL